MDCANPKYLNLVLELALLGESKTFPNPIVGAAIVYKDGSEDEKLLAASFHKEYGADHAEVNAVNEAIAKGYADLFKDSTIYVSLEPCSHHGKTPPCSDLIIKHHFKRLVFLSNDPNPLVQGKGIQKIISSGIEVLGPNELNGNKEIINKAKYINRAFFNLQKNNKAWFTLKIAATTNGEMTIAKEQGRWITNELSRKEVHRMRACHQLIITGKNTVAVDDCLLNVRHDHEDLGLDSIKQPRRLVLSRSGYFSNEEKAQFKIFNVGEKTLEFQISKNGDFDSLPALADALKSQGFQKIMIETGPCLAKQFIDNGLIDEIVHFANVDKDIDLKANIANVLESYEMNYPHIDFKNSYVTYQSHKFDECEDVQLNITLNKSWL